MKKRSLVGLIALFMVIAFLAISCDNAAGGGKSNGGDPSDDGGLSEALAIFKEEFGLEIAEDDVGAIMAAMMPMLIIYGETGEPVLGNGVRLESNEEKGTFTFTFEDYKVTDKDSGKEYIINGTYSFIDEITTSKITITGSTNGPVESDYTISGGIDMDEESEELPEFSGTLTIGSQTFDIKDIINFIYSEGIFA